MTGTTQDKSKVEISQNVVAFSEDMNFTNTRLFLAQTRNKVSMYKIHIVVGGLLVAFSKVMMNEINAGTSLIDNFKSLRFLHSIQNQVGIDVEQRRGEFVM